MNKEVTDEVVDKIVSNAGPAQWLIRLALSEKIKELEKLKSDLKALKNFAETACVKCSQEE